MFASPMEAIVSPAQPMRSGFHGRAVISLYRLLTGLIVARTSSISAVDRSFGASRLTKIAISVGESEGRPALSGTFLKVAGIVLSASTVIPKPAKVAAQTPARLPLVQVIRQGLLAASKASVT